MNNKICDNIKLDKKKLYFEIYNKLRLLGIKTSNYGAKLIYLAILIIINSNEELLIIEDVYSIISKQLGNVSTTQIRRSIQYTIDSRNKKKSENNFKMIFNFEYDETVFTNKAFIEELLYIIIKQIIE